MSVSSISGGFNSAVLQALRQASASQQASTTSALAGASVSPRDQFTSDLSTLFGAVQSGDMNAAGQALAQFQADQQNVYSPSATPASQSQSPLQNDFQSLISAVQSGDSGAAQKALTALQNDMAQRVGHHGHHRGHDSDAATATATAGAAGAAGVDTDGDNDGH